MKLHGRDFRRKIKKSLLINGFLYLLAGLIPCNSANILNLCTDWILEPIGILAVIIAQFSIFFNATSIRYYTSIGMNPFPNFSQFLFIWAIVLAPFYWGKIYALFTSRVALQRSKKTEKKEDE